MTNRFDKFTSWWDGKSSMHFAGIEDNVQRTLLSYGIRMRQDDGELIQINLSLPRWTESSIVLGLRYRKRDGTLTEDHFLFSQQSEDLKVTPYYRRALELILPEYKGTHKAQVNLPVHDSGMSPGAFVTDVRTITFTKVIK